MGDKLRISQTAAVFGQFFSGLTINRYKAPLSFSCRRLLLPPPSVPGLDSWSHVKSQNYPCLESNLGFPVRASSRGPCYLGPYRLRRRSKLLQATLLIDLATRLRQRAKSLHRRRSDVSSVEGRGSWRQDQFSWDDVKVDKHRENYLGHSIKAPVGRWQKGKDLHWYSRDKKSRLADAEAMKEEIKRIKEQEEQAMREALRVAPQRASRPQTNRLDKHEMKELVKRGSTAEDLGAGHAEAAHVQGLGYARPPRAWEESSSAQPSGEELSAPVARMADPPKAERNHEPDDPDVERGEKKRRREEKKRDRHEGNERHEKRHAWDSGDRKHRKHDKKRGHDSD